MFDDFDIYGCSIGPDYEDMIWDELDCMVSAGVIAVIVAVLPPAPTAVTGGVQ